MKEKDYNINEIVIYSISNFIVEEMVIVLLEIWIVIKMIKNLCLNLKYFFILNFVLFFIGLILECRILYLVKKLILYVI